MARENQNAHYDPIQASCNEIRLLTLEESLIFDAPICCKLRVTSLNEGPEYEALSYVWGDPSDSSKKEIFLQQETFWITPNLELALRYLRLKDRVRVLWVDSICINQSDLVERAEQVKLMGAIYKTACRDLLWIGADAEKYSQVLPILAYKYSSDYDTARAEYNDLVQRSDAVTWDQLVAFFREAVWQRMWIVQELVLAKEIRIICGSRELLSYELLLWLASTLLTPRYIFQLTQEAQKGSGQISRINYLRTRDKSCANPQGLLQVWYDFACCKCRDPRDKIYAMLNIVDDDLGVKPDYTIEAGQLFKNVTRRSIFQHQNLSILGYVRTLKGEADSKSKNASQNEAVLKDAPPYRLPSWSLDFGSDEEPHCPQFFYDRANVAEVENIIPWSTRSSQLLETPEDHNQLCLLGASLDKVVAVAESTRGWQEKDVVRYYRHSIIERLAEKYQPDDKYFNGDTIVGSYWKTICTGLARKGQDSWEVVPFLSGRESIPSSKTRPQSVFQKLFGRKSTTTASELHEQDLAVARSAQENLGNHLFITTGWSSFCMSERGYMALVPDTARTGDILCVLRGGCTPFVLRPAESSPQGHTEDELMTLIGPAYVYGFMEDLPLTWLEKGYLKERRFILV